MCSIFKKHAVRNCTSYKKKRFASNFNNDICSVQHFYLFLCIVGIWFTICTNHTPLTHAYTDRETVPLKMLLFLRVAKTANIPWICVQIFRFVCYFFTIWNTCVVLMWCIVVAFFLFVLHWFFFVCCCAELILNHALYARVSGRDPFASPCVNTGCIPI